MTMKNSIYFPILYDGTETFEIICIPAIMSSVLFILTNTMTFNPYNPLENIGGNDESLIIPALTYTWPYTQQQNKPKTLINLFFLIKQMFNSPKMDTDELNLNFF